MNKLKINIILCFIISYSANCQNKNYDRKIFFPDLDNYLTLVTDFHQHTVFSDGSVWPTIRVDEGIRDGLDAVSLTEHLEYQPYKNDIPHPDRNRSYIVASKYAESKNKSLEKKIIVINGQEITRSMPPGHINAIFINDANKLLAPDDSVKGILEANKQNAFVFWNHPGWPAQRSDGIARLDELHKYLIENKLLHGIEVVNELYYSEEALQIAIDNDLTIMGTSDIHGLVDWLFKVPDDYEFNYDNSFSFPSHRPVTLVFAKEKTKEGIKEALFNKRTAVFYNEMIIGREEYLRPLVKNCLIIKSRKSLELGYSEDGNSSIVKIEIENNSDALLTLKNLSPYSFEGSGDIIYLGPNSLNELSVKTRGEKIDKISFEVLNAITAPKENLLINLYLD